MADVGVLNLKIRSDAGSAAKSLGELADVLSRIKTAVQGGLGNKIEGVASAIGKLNQAVQSGLNSSAISATIRKLNELGDALGKLGSVSTINIHIRNSGVERVRTSVNQINEAVQGMNGGFATVGSRISYATSEMERFAESARSAQEIVQKMNMGNGYNQFSGMFNAWSSARSSRSLYGTSALSTNVETGWTNWKDGAIEVEGTVSDSTDTINGRLEGTQMYLTGVVEETQNVAKATDDWLEKAREINHVYKEKYGAFPARTMEDYFNGRYWGKDASGQNYQYTNKSDLMANWLHGNGTANEQKYAIGEVAKNLGISIDEAKQKIEELRGKLESVGKTSPAKGAIEEVKNEVQSAIQETTRLQKALDQVKNAGRGISKVWKEFKDGISNMHMPLSGLLSSFARIAKYRMLRAIIKGITEGIKEGTENVYMYSQAVGTSFAPAMDSAAASIAQFKNSVGAAAAPLIQAIIPVLNQIISAAITAVNWLNQLFALLGGQSSWTRALPQATKAFNETKKAAGGAGGAVKEMLAAFDELNVISSEGGGGGGGAAGALEDYETMFEQVTEFNETLKDIADFVTKNAEKLKETAMEIGAIVALWKVSEAFSGVIGKLATLAAAGLVMDVTWKMTAMFDEQYIDTGNEGWLIADAVTNAVGATLAGKLVSQVLGTGAGLITAGITLVVSGAISYGIATANDGTENAKNLARVGAAKLALGALLTGAGFYVSTGSMVAALFGAIATAPMFFAAATFVADLYSAKNAQQMAAEVFGRAGAGGISVSALYEALQEKFDEVSEPYRLSIEVWESRGEISQNLTSAAQTITRLNQLFTSGNVLTQEQADAYKQAWETVFSSYDKLKETQWSTIFEGFNAAMNTENKELREQARQTRIEIMAQKENMDLIEAEMIDKINTIADKIMRGLKVSDDEWEQYHNYIEHFGVNAESAMTTLRTILDQADTIDFGMISNNVDVAVQFIHDTMGSYNNALAEIDAGLEAQLAAINEQKKKAEDLFAKGLITEETRDAWIANMDKAAKEFVDAAEENKDQISKDVTEAFRKVFNTVKNGLKEFVSEDGILDWETAYDFIQGSLNPIIQAMKDSGADYHDIIKEAFNFGENLIDAFDIGDAGGDELIRFIISELTSVIDEVGNGLDLSSLPSLIFDPLNWDIEANRHDMAKTLIDYLGFDVAIASLKNSYNLNLSDLVNIIGYDTFTGNEKQQFLDALRSVFGDDAVNTLVSDYAKKTAEEYTAAMTAKLKGDRIAKLQQELRKKYPEEFKQLFNTIKDWELVLPAIDFENLDNSIDDLISFVKESGYDINTIIKNWKFVAPSVSGLSIETSLVAIERIVQTTGLDINEILKNWNLISPHIDEKNIDSSVKSITDTINTNRSNWQTVLGQNMNAPNINIPDGWGDNVREGAASVASNVKSAIEKVKPNVDIGVNLDISAKVEVEAEVSSTSGKVIRTNSNITKPSINTKYKLTELEKATGAYGIPAGNIFIAGEDGPELVGTMAGKTTVANQEQIIEGIQRGVYDANSEQNILLREQNNLLRQILQKDNSVRLGASSALGRTVRKSLDMYNMATGEA